eukprot:TRINITY_DN62434_c0_g2_i1.p1 TRINITY_DN62434_c0_g2~~TRINITY_DN62434_c0_g2_i1.p1  ORF type:complete len:229 (-),score=37.43 TRINITY_DN62434_c0_g2_i1:578-1264(-)
MTELFIHSPYSYDGFTPAPPSLATVLKQEEKAVKNTSKRQAKKQKKKNKQNAALSENSPCKNTDCKDKEDEPTSWPVPFPRPVQPGSKVKLNKNPRCKPVYGKKKKREIPHGDNDNPVCLDYLKGVCTHKRWRCKYAHPPLGVVPKAPQTERPVCTVFVLTGFCKYGDECLGLHPTVTDAICQPALTKDKDTQSTTTDEAASEATFDTHDTHSEHGSDTSIQSDVGTK